MDEDGKPNTTEKEFDFTCLDFAFGCWIVKICFPILAIKMDEKYYDNPEQFRPERFTSEEIKRRHKYVYMPLVWDLKNLLVNK